MSLTIGRTSRGNFSLPTNAVTQALAFIGRRGSGKTYGATKLAELLYGAGAQFVAIDPVGVWWGLRLGSDGKRKGLDVVIFGGLQGDIPLQPSAGELVADVIVERGISAVIDVSQFESDTDKARFARDFAARLFFLKKAKKSPIHVFVEEAQEFIPQNIQRGEEQMLHAWQRMIRLGRNYGIGVTMISQRPQDVNKKALNQAECVFAFQLTGPQERKAVRDWISEKGLDEDLADTLPHLKQGHAHVWSPVWLDISEVVHIGAKQTFAAGSTPEIGDTPIEAKPLAPVDLEKLKSSMAATIEQAKANDPKELKKRLTDLERQLAAKPKTEVDATATERAVARAVSARDDHWKGIVRIHETAFRKLQESSTKAHTILTAAIGLALPDTPTLPAITTPASRPAPARVISAPRPAASVNHADLTAPRQRILDALAWLHACRIERPNRTIVAYLADASPSSSAYMNNLGALRSMGMIDYPENGKVVLTLSGTQFASTTETPATPEDLHAAIYSKLPNAQNNILRALIAIYPQQISREDLASQAGASASSSAFMNNLGALRSLGLIDYPTKGYVAARPVLFLED